ncbi:hypothetical protein OsJ_31445 [Oryza sativa Japonica Group]|uniref:Endonuclease/exonuclease/phosphatase domain-containing protein n=1 Tax=Oryza sativa subsp. japonica TaxID=39947 RepID=A3C4I8_ORYSJ|nr:hypothetical protein OsJ_31445 [Oryza sativa Japonica Group]
MATLKYKSCHAEKFENNLNKKTFKIMTYNVWIREDIELHRRLGALGDLIQLHNPDFICFQVPGNKENEKIEPLPVVVLHPPARGLPPNLEAKLAGRMSKLPVSESNPIPFSKSIMKRELCVAVVKTGEIHLAVGTSHLESPCPLPPLWDLKYSEKRVAQAKQSLEILGQLRNAIFCGDMNWEDKVDGPFPLPDGWIDAWVELKPGDNGWTYDTKANAMLSANFKQQKRPDQFVCKLSDFKIDDIEMIGKEAIPGVVYYKEKIVRKEFHKLELPVLPSKHFGLVLTITLQDDIL